MCLVLPSSRKDTDPFFAGAVCDSCSSSLGCFLHVSAFSFSFLLEAAIFMRQSAASAWELVWRGHIHPAHRPHALKKLENLEKFWISLPVCATHSNKDASMFVVEPRCAEEALRSEREGNECYCQHGAESLQKVVLISYHGSYGAFKSAVQTQRFSLFCFRGGPESLEQPAELTWWLRATRRLWWWWWWW